MDEIGLNKTGQVIKAQCIKHLRDRHGYTNEEYLASLTAMGAYEIHHTEHKLLTNPRVLGHAHDDYSVWSIPPHGMKQYLEPVYQPTDEDVAYEDTIE